MNAIEVHASRSPELESDTVYLHCVMPETQSIPIIGLPCVHIRVQYIHFSYVDKPHVRRLAYLVNEQEQLAKLHGCRTPTLLKVLQSTTFQFHVQGDNEAAALLILQFDVLPSAPLMPTLINHTAQKDSPGTPLLEDEDTVACNCKPPKAGHVLCDYSVNHDYNDLESDSGNEISGDDSEQNDIDNNENSIDDEPTLNGINVQQSTININVKGSSFERFQPSLKQAREALAKNQPVSMSLAFEPTNIKDKNAVVVQFVLNNETRQVGYIGIQHLPRIHAALKNDSITRVHFLWIRRKYVAVINGFILHACISVTKTGMWLPQKPSNQYNSDI